MGANKFVYRGAAGELRWGYQQAAVLKDWELIESRLTATVVDQGFWTSDASLTFHVPGRSWSLPVVSLDISGTALTASLHLEG